MCNNYIYFSLKRIKFSFFKKTILNTIFIFDEDDDVLDNTVFFEFNDDKLSLKSKHVFFSELV